MEPCLGEHELLLKELAAWQSKNRNKISCDGHSITDDGRLSLRLSIRISKFQLLCPTNYPNYEDHFYLEAESAEFWCNALNEFILDSPKKLTLDMVLSKALTLHTPHCKTKSYESSSESDNENDADSEDEQFTTVDMDSDDLSEWEFMLCKKKNEWRAKEGELRLKLNQPKTSDMFDGRAMDHPKQVFSNSAASGILTNDLINIMETRKQSGINADALDNNIWKWSVYLSNFEPGSQMAKDLEELKKIHGYDYVELQLDFTMDLYPFYPPLLRFVRPKLKGAVVVNIACMNLLKLSYWNPARDMKSVLREIKNYIGSYGSVDIANKRNDLKEFHNGAYTNVEKHMLRLAMVSETQPRAMQRANMPDLIAEPMPQQKVGRVPNRCNMNLIPTLDSSKDDNAESVAQTSFPQGTGYSTTNSSCWDMQAFLAAQKEKDLQIEMVLTKILHDIKSEGPGDLLSPECDLPCTSTDSYSSFNITLQSSGFNATIKSIQEEHPMCVEKDPGMKSCQEVSDMKVPEYRVVRPTPMEFDSEPKCQKSDIQNSSKQCNIITNPFFESAQKSKLMKTHHGELKDAEVESDWSIEMLDDEGDRPDIMSSKTEKKDTECSTSRLNGNIETVGGSSTRLEMSSIMLHDCSINTDCDLYNFIEESSLLPFIGSKLTVDTFLEVSQHRSVYSRIIEILMEIASNPNLVALLGNLPMQERSIAELMQFQEQNASVVLEKMSKVMGGPDALRVRDHKVEGQEDEQLARDIVTLSQLIQSQLAKYCPHTSSDEVSSASNCQTLDVSSDLSLDDKCNFSLAADESLETIYKNALKDLQFCSTDIELETHSHKRHYKGVMPGQFVRIATELSILAKSLPLELSSGIFVRTDDAKCPIMRALIIGAEGTPYSGGCFSFDIYLDHKYPHVPPKVTFTTTGNGTASFNPNLYSNGVICLSLLGTWSGTGGEQWSSASTLLQVLISIQSLILVAEPYFNEPGYENMLGTPKGRKQSARYNEDVIENVVRYAMIEQIRNPTPGFEQVIRTHFYIKKNRILEELEQRSCSRLIKTMKALKQEFDKLKSPDPPMTE